jgi:hypothetical protein
MGQNAGRSSVIPQVKAFENTIFGPRTLGRTWGTRPTPSNFSMTQTPKGLALAPKPYPALRAVLLSAVPFDKLRAGSAGLNSRRADYSDSAA